MGVVKNVGFESFPRQSKFLGATVEVQFHYDGRKLDGRIIRDDAEAPFETLIMLQDERVVRAVECQYSPPLGRSTE